MMPKHTLLAVLVACTWCMASSAYATNTDGQTQGGNHDVQSGQSGSSGHLFGDHTGSGQSSGNAVPSPHSGSGSRSSSSCDPGSTGAGMGPHVSSCNSSGGSGGDASQSSPSWQSLLPGSIQ